jgi:membrane-associated phospholipid phosphatase
MLPSDLGPFGSAELARDDVPMATSVDASTLELAGGRLPWTSLLTRWMGTYRLSESIILAYFVYTALMVALMPASRIQRTASCLIPLALGGLLSWESRVTRPWSRVIRDWGLLGTILIAYWQLQWLSGMDPQVRYQAQWVSWDRILLNQLHLRAAIESLGWVIPSALDAMYLALYAFPPVCLGILYLRLRRSEVNRFLATLFVGALSVYAILPHFPAVGPRLAFPGQDMPNYGGMWHSINVWLLDHGDISTGVFPSGHVAVAFASAFGLLRARCRRPWVCGAVFVAAAMVFLATIYCRYHYAVDGLASIGVTLTAWRVLEAMESRG